VQPDWPKCSLRANTAPSGSGGGRQEALGGGGCVITAPSPSLRRPTDAAAAAAAAAAGGETESVQCWSVETLCSAVAAACSSTLTHTQVKVKSTEYSSSQHASPLRELTCHTQTCLVLQSAITLTRLNENITRKQKTRAAKNNN